MIGVLVREEERAHAGEFFELFKTPWEFLRDGRRYDFVLCTLAEGLPQVNAKTPIWYSTAATSAASRRAEGTTVLRYKSRSLPVYGRCVTTEQGPDVLTHAESGRPALWKLRQGDTEVVRIGFDLFHEIATLLNGTQPIAFASCPAVELHISILRDLMVESGTPFVEIPPVPHGYRFLACLTHDVDHAMMKRHYWDATIFGFLYRALVGSVLKLAKRRISFSGLLRNWLAAAKLPFVYLGFAEDPWCKFTRYPELERGHRSTFFVIPYKGKAGRTRTSAAPRLRAAGYSAADIASEIRTLMNAGCEIGLHGINAWIDASDAKQEAAEITRITGQQSVGVRMHWLYFDNGSHGVLESAGLSYDSTAGYNECVGYRVGTTQVCRPRNAEGLFELPLHIMDTALFFPSHMNLSPEAATAKVDRMIADVLQFGGCLTINWHDRSIFPERLWSDVYRQIVLQLENDGAWFGTASQVVEWFRKRRSAVFETADGEPVNVKLNADSSSTPALELRVYNDHGGMQQRVCVAETPRCVSH